MKYSRKLVKLFKLTVQSAISSREASATVQLPHWLHAHKSMSRACIGARWVAPRARRRRFMAESRFLSSAKRSIMLDAKHFAWMKRRSSIYTYIHIDMHIWIGIYVYMYICEQNIWLSGMAQVLFCFVFAHALNCHCDCTA